jgi:hypothetical protein
MPCELPTDQPLIKAHPPPNTKYVDISKEQIDPREIHHVVVPYAPLASATTRFYDWPPEPEFANVKYKPPVTNSNGMDGGMPCSVHKVNVSNGSIPDVATSGTVPRWPLPAYKPLRQRSFSSDLETRSNAPPPRRRAKTDDMANGDDSKFKFD